jgi:hypothetical protein
MGVMMGLGMMGVDRVRVVIEGHHVVGGVGGGICKGPRQKPRRPSGEAVEAAEIGCVNCRF